MPADPAEAIALFPYRVIAEAASGAPNARPGKTVPSASARSAGPRSPTRGSTIAAGSGSGGRVMGT